MSDNNSNIIVHPVVIEVLPHITGLHSQLPGDPRRQAVDSISGNVYQAWWSIDAWLRLANADEVVYLEGSEDFDIVKEGSAITVQVKRNTGTISLGTTKAHEALENFWSLCCKEFNRYIEFHFLTTSSIAMEQAANFGGLKGIESWRAAQTNIDLAADIAKYLVTKLSACSPLRSFLITAEPSQVQERLIRRFHWLTDQPDITSVKQSVDNRIAVLLNEHRRPISLIANIRNCLESRYWEIILESSSSSRCLTRGELLRQVEKATTTYMPIPIEQLPELLSNAKPGWDLLNLSILKPIKPPEPLLRRPELTQRLEELVKHRKVVLLTGTVHKGKTTVAQLVSITLCPNAWWVKLTGLTSVQVDHVIFALASRIESGDCPSLAVIDDLDISPTAHRVYRDSLALVLHRATKTGRSVILTAQGASSDLVVVQEFNNVEILDVPEVSAAETTALCIEHGCPQHSATIWGALITAWTRGHPKLVQVRLVELATHSWPLPTPDDFITASTAVASTRLMARQMLCGSELTPVVEFVYLVSECTVPMHRSVGIRLAEKVDGLTNGGDVIDHLAGKWLERLDGDYFRTTALLNGVANDVWSPEKRKWVHICLHDAILAKHTLDPAEAAALLSHAYFGGDPSRLARTAMRLQVLESDDAKREVERQLLWLPFVALELGQSITDEAFTGAILRGLQFRVACTLDSESLPQICERWAEDIERIQLSDAKAVNRCMMWMSILSVDSPRVSLKLRLEAISGISSLPSELLTLQAGLSEHFFQSINAADGIPNSGTTTQAMFLSVIKCVRDLTSLVELLQWLDSVATDEIRQQFDSMLEWPLIQELGAFVLGAFAAIHEQTNNWEPWLDLLQRMDEYAILQRSPRFGRIAAKTKAIILTEYLSRSEDALKLLEQAEALFGPSPMLMEQRANVMFQTNDDESMLAVWRKLTIDPASKATLDPYAYRRAGMSAARLKQWEKAGQIFLDGAHSIQLDSLELTKFGLCVDAALAISLGGDQTTAANVLSDAVLSLPSEATSDGNEHWESVQRVASSVCSFIGNAVWNLDVEDKLPLLECGLASRPELKFTRSDTGKDFDLGQTQRSELTRAQVLHLVSTIGKNPAWMVQELKLAARSKYCYVRLLASEARIASNFAEGAGNGFIEELLFFDKTISEVSVKNQKGASWFEADEGPTFSSPVAPERWFGLLCAGIICSGQGLVTHLKIWLDDSTRLLGKDATLTYQIRQLLKGATMPSIFLTATISDPTSSIPIKYGAVAQLLCNGLPARNTLQAQAFLTSELVRDDVYFRQQIFNRHVARRFAETWRMHAQNRFQFYSPNKTVPVLLATLDGIDHGNTTLKRVLVAASTALQEPHVSFIERVL